MTFRKKNGETVDIDSEEPMSFAELAGLLGYSDDQGAAVDSLAKRVEAVEKRPAPAASAPIKPDWKRATITITSWDDHGRVKAMNLEKIF